MQSEKMQCKQISYSDLVSTQVTCSNGDVGLVDDGTPFIFWGVQWYPICGHYFWDNDVGAKLICNKLGYPSGQVFRNIDILKPKETYSEDSFKIGKCKINDELENCSGGCNDYQAGNYCGNENIKDVANGNPGARCEKNHGPRITIKCLGDEGKRSTCHGGNRQCRAIRYGRASYK